MSKVVKDTFNRLKEDLGKRFIHLDEGASYNKKSNRFTDPSTKQFIKVNDAVEIRSVIKTENSLLRIGMLHGVDREEAQSMLDEYNDKKGFLNEMDLEELIADIFGERTP